MKEVHVDLSAAVPRLLDRELAGTATWLITMGCGDECPVVPGVRREDWPLEDPKGQSLERVREIRDEIRERIEQFVTAHHWSRPALSYKKNGQGRDVPGRESRAVGLRS